MIGLLDELVGLFTDVEGSGNVAIGVRMVGWSWFVLFVLTFLLCMRKFSFWL
jgi:hypothetical protein